MSRRSHATLRATERSRRAAHDSYLTEREQKSKVFEAIRAVPSMKTEDVVARLNRADELDRKNSERRLAEMRSLDLGEP